MEKPNLVRASAACLALFLGSCGREGPTANVSHDEVAAELAQVRIEPGLWERSSTIVHVAAQGAPREMVSQMMQRRGGGRHCITPEQAARPQANFIAGREASRCVSRSFDMRDGRISGAMVCRDSRSGGEWSARMQGRYAPAEYELEMVMEMPNPWDPAQMLITSRIVGRRVGPCAPPSSPGGGAAK